jgi:hypothetical protein
MSKNTQATKVFDDDDDDEVIIIIIIIITVCIRLQSFSADSSILTEHNVASIHYCRCAGIGSDNVLPRN